MSSVPFRIEIDDVFFVADAGDFGAASSTAFCCFATSSFMVATARFKNLFFFLDALVLVNGDNLVRDVRRFLWVGARKR